MGLFNEFIKHLEKNRKDKAENMIKNGFNINLSNGKSTPLGIMVRADNKDMVRFLLSKGASPNASVEHPWVGKMNIMRLAILGDNIDIVKSLVKYGGVVSKSDKEVAEGDIKVFLEQKFKIRTLQDLAKLKLGKSPKSLEVKSKSKSKSPEFTRTDFQKDKRRASPKKEKKVRCGQDKIINPKTGRCIKKGGAVHKKLLKAGEI